MAPLPTMILTINNLGFLWMQLEPTCGKPLSQGPQQVPCLLFRAAMQYPVIRITTPFDGREALTHPAIERIVKKQVRQHRADHTALRSPLAPLSSTSITIGAVSHRRIYSRTHGSRVCLSTARSNRSCGMLSNSPLISNSSTQS